MEVQPQTFNPDPRQAATAQAIYVLNARARSGTDWFFWIAGLSLINSIASLAGTSFSFVAGLGVTRLIDAFATLFAEKGSSDSGMIIHIIALLINLTIIGIFAIAGILARKHYRWVVVAGMALYALDTLSLFLFNNPTFSLIFHGLALWGLWNGLRALNALKKLEEPSF